MAAQRRPYNPREEKWGVLVKHFFFALTLGLAVSASAQVPKMPCTTPEQDNAFLGIQTIRLWPGEAPQAKGKDCEDIPTLTIFEPHPGNGNGSAVVVFPGGAYYGLAANLEGNNFTSQQLGDLVQVLAERSE